MNLKLRLKYIINRNLREHSQNVFICFSLNLVVPLFKLCEIFVF